MMRSQIFAPLSWNRVDEWVAVGRLFHKKGIHNPSAITSPHHVLRKTQIDGRSFAVMQLALFIANPGIVSIVNALATTPRGQSAVQNLASKRRRREEGSGGESSTHGGKEKDRRQEGG